MVAKIDLYNLNNVSFTGQVTNLIKKAQDEDNFHGNKRRVEGGFGRCKQSSSFY